MKQSIIVLAIYHVISKKVTGKTISQLISEAKLRLAQDLLANTNMPISEIAEQIGYTSESHFFKLFKNNYQITPDHYRRLMSTSQYNVKKPRNT
ncbi:helix-turn-helix domain-containing protein [Streptococcus sp. S784/96/1]|uniref:helix-turn-helix domain-containing protein n=1 Tax=Streptococcus sp. S784/96/1 TaxID=2653499 RepID=UPI003FD14794